jgi:imidazolonepropionase-like amidohydrolase
MKNILAFILTFLLVFPAIAQNPAPNNGQSKPMAIINAKIVVGNGTVYENGTITFKNGLIEEVGVNIPTGSEYTVIDVKGKHVYPGIISPNSQVGLNEIAAVRTTHDYAEIGQYNPNIRSIVAYNTDSEVIPTVRSNGVLVAQVTPVSGVISGSSSIVYNDGWNWEDAVIKTDEGIWITWPQKIVRSFNFQTYEVEEKKNEQYEPTIRELEAMMVSSQAYAENGDAAVNLKLEAMKGLFDGTKQLFINADDGKQIIEAIKFAERLSVKKSVIVGAEESDLAIEFMKSRDVPVLVNSTHRRPNRTDDAVWSAYELPKKLMDAGLTVGMYYNDSYWRSRNLPFVAGNCVAHGMSQENALKMITLNNAKILGIDDILGTLETGKHATFIVTTGDVLDMRFSKVEHAFIKGGEVDLDDKQKRLYEKYRTKYGLD